MTHFFSDHDNIVKVVIYFEDHYKDDIDGISFHSEEGVLVTLGTTSHFFEVFEVGLNERLIGCEFAETFLL
jgi:hypothetical protein